GGLCGRATHGALLQPEGVAQPAAVLRGLGPGRRVPALPGGPARQPAVAGWWWRRCWSRCHHVRPEPGG
ncbi:unnamed protein product, partial [Heterosigma akashiwo]